jgi:ABC-2 type transport system permease protein
MKLRELRRGVVIPFFVMAQKDLRLAFRNPMLFGLLVFTPFLMIAVLSEAFSPMFEGRSTFQVPVVDLLQQPESARVVDQLDALSSIELEPITWEDTGFTGSDAADVIARDRDYFAVLVIGGDPDSPGQPLVTLYSDPAQAGFAGIIEDQVKSRLAVAAIEAETVNESGPEVSLQVASEASTVPSRFEQTVPGFSVMFTFWLATLLAATVYIERKQYGTWRRTLVSPAPGWTIVGSRMTAYVLLGLSQMLVMFLLGGIFFGINLGWNILPLMLIFLALALVTTAFGFLMSALVSDMGLLSVAMNLLVIGMALLGGALVPVDYLPGIAQKLAFLTPHYWALDAIQKVILVGGQTADVAANIAVLLMFAAGCFLLGSLRFRISD